ncbi:MAG: glutamate racemase [Eubacteriales bacterium]|nr:glutamate racemase [Eubacteriales bacterium]
MSKNQPIGVFDSGSGGISVLRAFRHVMPQEHYFYFGDHKNLPYGEKSHEEIRTLTISACDAMAAQSLKALVIACNSASTAALDKLRSRYPIPVLGIEPPVAQAAELPGTGSFLVMATTATLASPRFQSLASPFGDRVIPLPCPGLVELIEAEDTAGQKEYLRHLFEAVCIEDVDALVLACTHFPLIKDTITQAFQKPVSIIDGYKRAAESLKALLKIARLINEPGQTGQVSLTTSGDAEIVARLTRFLLARPGFIQPDNPGDG